MKSVITYLFQSLRLLSPLGQPYFLAAFVLAMLLLWLWWPLGLVALMVALGLVAVYTDRPRLVPDGGNVVVAPLDGYLTEVHEGRGLPLGLEHNKTQTETARLVLMRQSMRLPRVVRAPVTGVVREITRLPASAAVNTGLPWGVDAMAMLLVGDDGAETVLVLEGVLIPHQIALSVKVGDVVRAGDRLGLVVFLARAELYIPALAPLLRAPGQSVTAGETVLMVATYLQAPRFRVV
jgi:phosphatidylserine decarboxylase